MDALPTKAQIAAIDDPEALTEIKDAVDLAIAHIEAQLEFSARDETWAHTAINALALHRHVERLLHRRLEALAKAAPPTGGRETSQAGRDRRPLTLEVLAAPPQINIPALNDAADVDAWSDWLTQAIDAVSNDREDETGLPAAQRDERFMSASGRVLRTMRGQRQQLQTRRGQLTKAAATAEHQARNADRAQLFIDAAREHLPPDTFAAIWATVDGRQLQAAAA